MLLLLLVIFFWLFDYTVFLFYFSTIFNLWIKQIRMEIGGITIGIGGVGRGIMGGEDTSIDTGG